jgi:hypothetical protein
VTKNAAPPQLETYLHAYLDAPHRRVTNLLDLLDNMINAAKDEQLVIFFIFPSRPAAFTEAVRRACRLDTVFDLMELNDRLVGKLDRSVQLAQIMVVLGFQFGEGAVDGGMSFGMACTSLNSARPERGQIPASRRAGGAPPGWRQSSRRQK